MVHDPNVVSIAVNPSENHPRCLPDTAIFQAGLSPERTGNLTRVDAGFLPPSPFVAGTVEGAVVDSAERHREFVACFAAERAWLRIAKMMRVRRLTATHQASLLGDKSDVVLVPNSTGLRQGEPALVDIVGAVSFAGLRNMRPEPQRGLDGPSGHRRHLARLDGAAATDPVAKPAWIAINCKLKEPLQSKDL
jgi:hypothetical protein